MRSEEEMLGVILKTAASDERIRAVYMNGSRVNPAVEKDEYQDYDVVFVVTETAPFLRDKSWLGAFGEIAVLQEPDSNGMGWGIGGDFQSAYTWLMIFTDGNRVDLQILVKAAALKTYGADTLTVPLLDKDNILPPIPAASDRGYWIKPPAQEQYRGCCNEFWWCLGNVAKAIARKQLPYAMRMYMGTVHAELERMTEWHIGINYNFAVSAGMWGKYYRRYLSPELYALFVKTYSDGGFGHLWAAIDTACQLFGGMAREVGGHFQFEYHIDEERNMRKYLSGIKK